MANLKDLIVNGSARILGTLYANLNGTATKATQDASGNVITTTYATKAEITTGVFAALYPVGSIYIGTQATCPLATLLPGSTWTKVEGRYLLASGTIEGTEESVAANDTISAALPQHAHSVSITSSDVSQGHTHWYEGTTGGQSQDHTHGGAAGSFAEQKVYHNDDWNGGWFCLGTTSTGGTSQNHVHGYSGTTAGASQGHTHGVSGNTGNTTVTTIYGQSATVRPTGYAVNVWRRTA